MRKLGSPKESTDLQWAAIARITGWIEVSDVEMLNTLPVLTAWYTTVFFATFGVIIMSPDTQLLPLDAEELLHEIRCGHQRDLYGNEATEAVRFYPIQSRSNGHIKAARIPSEDNFSEHDYLRLHADAAAAVERGEFRSGYEHWINCGKQEGRSFEPLEFCETDYLQLHPDVLNAVRDGAYTSGREHWLQCGRLEGRRVKMPLPLFNSRLIDLDIQSRTAISGIGEIPPTPATPRARFGRWLIAGIRGLLWWYTEPLRRFAQITDQRFRAFTDIFEHLGNKQEEQRLYFDALRHDVDTTREQLSGIASQNISERVEHLTAKLMKVQSDIGAWDNRLESTVQSLRQSWTEQFSLSEIRFRARLEAQKAEREVVDRRVSDEITLFGARLSEVEQRLRDSNARLDSRLAAEGAEREALRRALLNEASHEAILLGQRLNKVEIDIAHSDARLDRGLGAEMSAREDIVRKLSDLKEESSHLEAHSAAMQRDAEQMKTELTFHILRVNTLLAEAHSRCPGAFEAQQPDRTGNAETDALYVAFENAFRGSRDDVKKRQSIYLAHLTDSGAGTPQYPVLDLGCGRGEWLELLRDHGLIARGVDRNRLMIELCGGMGLDVVEANVLSFLRDLPDGAFGAITAFHVVEHIPFDNLLGLLDQALRLLKPGGLLILETPNPSNLTVASHNFYLDPTHLHPLPSQMLRFFVEARGFCNSRVLALHPCQVPLTSATDALSQRLNELFTGPQDYAIIAESPQSQAS